MVVQVGIAGDSITKKMCIYHLLLECLDDALIDLG